jgi:hypothetical protein
MCLAMSEFTRLGWTPLFKVTEPGGKQPARQIATIRNNTANADYFHAAD